MGRGTVQLHWLLSSLRPKGGTKGDEIDSSKQPKCMYRIGAKPKDMEKVSSLSISGGFSQTKKSTTHFHALPICECCEGLGRRVAR